MGGDSDPGRSDDMIAAGRDILNRRRQPQQGVKRGEGAVGEPPGPHRGVGAAADDDRGGVGQRACGHRGHPAVVAGEGLVAGVGAALGPAGVPWPTGCNSGDAGRQVTVAEPASVPLEFVGPGLGDGARKLVGGLL